jgi:hypothetical protein
VLSEEFTWFWWRWGFAPEIMDDDNDSHYGEPEPNVEENFWYCH